MPRLRSWLFIAVCSLLCSLVVRPLAAARPTQLSLEAAPLLGPSAPASEGWFSYSVRLHNTSDAPVEGAVELVGELSWSKEQPKNLTRAPFNVPAKSAVLIELPTHGFFEAPPSIKIRALDPEGHALATLDLPDFRASDPLLFDMTVPSRISSSVRGMPLAVETTASHSRGGYGAPQLAVGGPQVNPVSGALVLPSRAAGYAAVSILLARSQDLVALGGAELDALVNWVLGGGSLALVISRPEDLLHATLKALAGGEIKRSGVASALKEPAPFLVAPDPNRTSDPSLPPSYPGLKNYRRKRERPSDDVRQDLVGFEGGNLHPSLWGSSASYGLGEVHLLAFDVTREPSVSSEWVKLKVADLVRHAIERQASIVLPHAQSSLDSRQIDQIRRQIDPNENTRWTIAVSAFVLLIYAVLAGPVNFYLASKKGQPLRALWRLPIWALLALISIVVLGVIGKGVEGRARRITLVEAGAGMSRAAITRFRGLFAATSSDLSVRASDRGSVLDVAGESDDTTRVISVERDITRLDRLRSKPWQTIVVREDGFVSLGGGVSLVKSGGSLVVKNRLARDLLSVLVKVPGKNVVYFSRIADGASVDASAGRSLSGLIGRSTTGTSATAHGLESSLFMAVVDEHGAGAGSAWQALENFVVRPVDWWPSDVPVLLAQVEGGEGKTSDSGLRLDMDRMLLRVVGYGGVP